ncbi:membrane protein (plasmid) [Nicoliella spurrieriana]|uniref:Membrane protein n=1 Tax=Nicoliella spurrieriana TaxID=2925830 RepID=A0A976RQW3_9LACO|nr:membrane protein [Nicoliella spurrieriana]UQS86152.1 membrane protein [Nicoliella spurrieriana]
MADTNAASNQLEDNNVKQLKNKFINIILKSLMSFVGIAILSMGAAFLKQANLGMDPFTAMNIGFSNTLHMELGSFQLMVNIGMFILVLIFGRKQIGIGTILNMVLVGYEIQWFSSLYGLIFPHGSGIYVVIVDVIAGLLLFTLGTSIYTSPSLGAAPYDAIAPIFSSRLHIKYQLVRNIQDITFMVIAFFAHGAVGILTLVVAFFAGPLINYWNEHFSQQMVYHIDHFSAEPTIKNASSGIAGVGKMGYSMVVHAYQQTNFVEQHLSGYSDEELIELTHNTQRSIEKSVRLQRNLQTRLNALNEEARKRHIKIPKLEESDELNLK